MKHSIAVKSSHKRGVCGCAELELSKVEVVLNEPHRPSPKSKATRSSTVRRHRKRATGHLRPQHLDEELSAVTTAEDDEVIQRIKHVPGLSSSSSSLPHEPLLHSHVLLRLKGAWLKRVRVGLYKSSREPHVFVPGFLNKHKQINLSI